MSKKNVNIALDREFQEEIASLILKDNHFSAKFLSLVSESDDLKDANVQVFTDKRIDRIIRVFVEVYNSEDKTLPTPGILKNVISRKDWGDEEVKELVALVNKISLIEVKNKSIHEKEIVTLITSVIAARFIQDTYKKAARNPDMQTLSEIPDLCQALYLKTNKIGFSSTETIFPDNGLSLIEEANSMTTENLPTGFKEIDAKLNGGGVNGGMSRHEVTLIISPVNDGKSTVLTNITVNNAIEGRKVLHISLEGKKFQPILRSIAKSARVSYARMTNYAGWRKEGNVGKIEAYFTPEEVAGIKKSDETLGQNARFSHEIHKNALEDLLPFIREKYQEEKFDLLVIDYAQKVTSRKVFPRHDLMYEYIFAEFEKLAVELNCAVLTAMQVKNEGINRIAEQAAEGIPYPIFRRSDCADSKKPVDISATVLAWCRTDEERQEAKGRLAIIKQREGLTQYQAGYAADWDYMDLSGGKVYWQGLGEGDNKNNQKQGTLAKLKEAAAWGFKADVSIAKEDGNLIAIHERIEKSKAFSVAHESANKLELKQILKTLEQRSEFLLVKENLEINKSTYDPEEHKKELSSINLQIREIEEDPELKGLITMVFGDNLTFYLAKVNQYVEIIEDIHLLKEEHQTSFETLVDFGNILLDVSEFSTRFEGPL